MAAEHGKLIKKKKKVYAPVTVPIRTKICMVGSLPDLITYAKFQVEIFRGYNFTWVEFPTFLSFLHWALQH